MSVHKKIFLASRFEEFSYIRKMLKEELVNLGMDIVDLNDNIADSHPPIERSLENVRRSDIMILLIGDTYGTVPFEELKSYTHLEYDEALNNQLDIYIFCIGKYLYFKTYVDCIIN